MMSWNEILTWYVVILAAGITETLVQRGWRYWRKTAATRVMCEMCQKPRKIRWTKDKKVKACKSCRKLYVESLKQEAVNGTS